MSDKPMPRPNADSAPFWEACNRGELIHQRCRACGHRQFYPRAVCVNCQSDDLAWAKTASAGEVYSYTVVQRAPTKAFRPDVPYVVALVDLADGVRMMMNLRDCDPDAAHIGMKVRIVFEQGTDGQALPQAVPA